MCEYGVKYYSIDICLSESELFVEIMGDYWHCSPMEFINAEYEFQKAAIIRDAKKRNYCRNSLKKQILNLWESDVLKDMHKCELLIDRFIEQQGMLDNYESFNYHIEDNNVIINDNIVTPYFENLEIGFSEN